MSKSISGEKKVADLGTASVAVLRGSTVGNVPWIEQTPRLVELLHALLESRTHKIMWERVPRQLAEIEAANTNGFGFKGGKTNWTRRGISCKI